MGGNPGIMFSKHGCGTGRGICGPIRVNAVGERIHIDIEVTLENMSPFPLSSHLQANNSKLRAKLDQFHGPDDLMTSCPT